MHGIRLLGKSLAVTLLQWPSSFGRSIAAGSAWLFLVAGVLLLLTFLYNEAYVIAEAKERSKERMLSLKVCSLVYSSYCGLFSLTVCSLISYWELNVSGSARIWSLVIGAGFLLVGTAVIAAITMLTAAYCDRQREAMD